MDDRIYQDPFDLDFPDIVEEVQLDEGPINAIKKKVAAAEAKKEYKARLKDWIRQSFSLQSERFGASTPADTKQFSDSIAIYWDRYVIAYCTDPFVEKPEISFKEFSTFEDAMKQAEKLATKISSSEVVKKIPKYILTKEKGEGGRIPLFVCVDRLKLKDSLETVDVDQDAEAWELRQAFGDISTELNHICPSAYNLGRFSDWEGKEGLKNLTCLVYYAIGDNFGNSTVQSTSPKGLADFDVRELLEKSHDSSVELEEPEDTSEEPVEPAEESKTDRFETEEFKVELKDIGLTDLQIEKLYANGASILKALAELNLDDIDEEEGE
jgi:hypothetical protein